VATVPAAAPFETLHFTGHTLTGRELIAAIESAADWLGMRPSAGFRLGTMPWGFIRTAGLVYPLWRELARMSYLWRVPHALDGTALAARVNLRRTPLAESLVRTLVDLGLAPGVALSSPGPVSATP
jgi:hypothetical protein